MNTHTIAIDFGTTKTLVSHINPRTNSPEIIRLGRDGRDYIPTTAYIDKRGKFYFGDDADDLIEEREGQYLRGFKMKLGSSNQIAFSKKDGKICRYSAKDLVERYLRHIREEVENLAFMGEKISTATITHPVAFSPLQLQDLTQAAQNAGFENVSFITEPEAAGIAFCKENAAQAFRKNALIVDWGGGTLDIALVTRKDGIIQTHPTLATGLNGIGGELFDECLWSHIISCLQEKGNYKLDASSQIKHVRRGKERLSKHEDVKLHLSTLSGIVCPGIQISRNTFEKLIDTHVDKAVDKILRLVQQIPAENKPEFLLLVGGSSLIPCIKKKLEATCGLQTQSWHKSREAVSIGAAYHSTASGTKNIWEILTDKSALENWLQQGNDANARLEAISSETGEAVSASLIFMPAISGNIKCVETLLRYGADINAKDSLGRTVLHAVTSEQNNEMVDFLLTHQANPNIQDNDGCTALHIASTDKNEKIISTLLSHQANPNIKNNSGLTALHRAALESADKCIELLLKGGANPNIQDNDRCTALHYTCFEPEEDDEYTIDDCCRCVQLLIEHNCHLSTKDKDGDTPLLLALQENSRNTAKLLYEAGADTNIKNNNGECANDYLPDSWKQQKQIEKLEDKQSAIEELAREYDITGSYDKELISAAQKGATKRLILLISAGANINYTDSDKKCTALSLAVQNQRIETVKILLTQPNIDVNKDLPLEKAVKNDAMECFNLLLEASTIDVNSAIHAAAQQKNPQFLYKLLNRKEANVNQKNANGLTPLHLAAAKNNTDHVVYLLQQSSIDVNMETMNGNSALMLAISSRSTGAFGQLIKYKNLRINHRNNDGYTALHVAIREKAPLEYITDLVRYKGININAKTTKKGKTPLHLALENNYMSAARHLLHLQPNINEQDATGNTALHIAAQKNQIEMLEMLDTMLEIKGIQVNATTKNGYTPLHLAVVHNNASAVLHLLNYQGIDVNCSNHEAETPLHIAVEHGNLAIINYLTNREYASAGINRQNSLGLTPLNLAVTKKRADIVQALLKVKNINVNMLNKYGETALHQAARYNERYILKQLLKDPRINVNTVDSEGNSALHIAAREDHPEIVKDLLSLSGIHINLRNKQGKTPYALTIRHKWFQWTQNSHQILKEKGGKE